MPELLSYWLPLDDASPMIRYLNDQIAAMIEQAPDRFIGLGGVPLQDVDSAVREMSFCLKELHFSGIEIASHVNGVSIGDARFEPFFAAARAPWARRSSCTRCAPPARTASSAPFPEQAVCFPGDIALACASMITGGIAARHPKLRIAFSHGGGGMAILLPRLVHAWNMFPKAKASLPESPEIAARRFYYDELVFEPRAIRFLLETFGENQICIGTDYPFAMGDFTPMNTLQKAGFDREMLKRIAFKNARRFLGLPAASR